MFEENFTSTDICVPTDDRDSRPSEARASLKSKLDSDQDVSRSSVKRTLASRENIVLHALEHSVHLLPAQGPIGVFVHHNTLHAFQEWNFEEAVEVASQIFGAEPYWPEDAYRDALRNGRIVEADVHAALEKDPLLGSKNKGSSVNLKSIYHAVLLYGVSERDEKSVQWRLEHAGMLKQLPLSVPLKIRAQIKNQTVAHISALLGANQLRELASYLTGQADATHADQILRRRIGIAFDPRSIKSACETKGEALAASALWSACTKAVKSSPFTKEKTETSSVKSTSTHEVDYFMSRFCSVFLDQGVARAPLPDRDLGLYGAFRNMILEGPVPTLWLKPARESLKDLWTPMSAILWALQKRGISDQEIDPLIEAELLALPGWAGLIHRLSVDPGLAPRRAVRASVLEYLAIRLICGVFASPDIHVGNTKDSRLKSLIHCDQRDRTWDLYGAASALGWAAASNYVGSLPMLLQVLDEFPGSDRRRVLHLAYEHHHQQEVLGAIHALPPHVDHASPEIQFVTCIDEREESFRRHIEEQGEDLETLGAAGFFGVAMNYQGLDDVTAAPYCPVVVKPEHLVSEKPLPGLEWLERLRKNRRRLWGKGINLGEKASGEIALGPVMSLFGGLAAISYSMARVLFPSRVARLTERLFQRWVPAPDTSLMLLNVEDYVSSAIPRRGFTVDEKAERVGRFLTDTGLIKRMAPTVILLGHGSTSLNNPHESAHDCGACGGRRGGANARAFAAMANHPLVRQRLVEKGVVIPPTTWFVGGYHDTSTDEVTLYDESQIPKAHRQANLVRIREVLDRARSLSAHERTRRFELHGGVDSAETALRHVEDRASSWAEPRPEYGHCTNAVAIVGRRNRTRGLFLDRRAFLVSYDPLFDSDASQLTRILGAVGPVCSGINLEYYFSSVDNERYGCGTKLPHNITGLVGVVNGHSSDLRTGLPWQMVELHEPVRLLLVIETTCEKFMQVIASNAEVRQLVENRWMRVALLNPNGNEIVVYERGVFSPFVPQTNVLPSAENSRSWYGGRRDFLGPAFIKDARSRSETKKCEGAQLSCH